MTSDDGLVESGNMHTDRMPWWEEQMDGSRRSVGQMAYGMQKNIYTFMHPICKNLDIIILRKWILVSWPNME